EGGGDVQGEEVWGWRWGELVVWKRVNADRFCSAASERFLRLLAFRGWGGRPRCWRRFGRNSRCQWACGHSLFFIICSGWLLDICRRRPLLTFGDFFELQAELHRGVKETIDGFKWHREAFGNAAEGQTNFESFLSNFQLPELVLQDDCHFVGILRT